MEKTLKPSDLRSQALDLVKKGKMPKAQELLKAIAEARQKYAPKIRHARKS